MSARVLVLARADEQRLIGWDPDGETTEREARGFISVARRHGYSGVTVMWRDRDRDWFALSR